MDKYSNNKQHEVISCTNLLHPGLYHKLKFLVWPRILAKNYGILLSMRRISHLTDLRTLLDPWLMENHKPSQSFLELHGELKVQIFSLFKGQGLTEDSLKECQANRSSKQVSFKHFPKEEMTILTWIWFNGSIYSSSVVFPSFSLLGHICHHSLGFIFFWAWVFYAAS